MSIVGKYTKDQAEHAAHMMAIVMQGLTEKRESFLGPVLEEIGAANTKNGQFLTPVSISDVCARITADGLAAKHVNGEIVTANDPACGAGVMLISMGEALLAAGIPQRDILLVGGDIDSRACDIAFIELSLLGYAARIEHQDALTLKEYSRPRWTVGYYLHGTQWREHRGKREPRRIYCIEIASVKYGQKHATVIENDEPLVEIVGHKINRIALESVAVSALHRILSDRCRRNGTRRSKRGAK